MGLKTMFFGGIGVAAALLVTCTTIFQTADDAYNNEPDEGENKGQQIVGDAASNAVKLTVSGAEKGLKALVKEGDRLVGKYSNSATNAVDKVTNGGISVSECETSYDSDIVFGKECAEYFKLNND